MRRAVVVVALLAACGGSASPPTGDDDGDDDDDDTPVAPDAAPADEPPDAAPAACAAPAPLGELATITAGTAVIDANDGDGHRIDFDDPIGPADAELLLRFAFIEGHGAFTNGLATGTYTIEGDDAGVECGLCTLMFTSYFHPDDSQYFLATSGSYTFDRVDETADGRVVGTATNLVLTRFVYKDGGWIESEGCETRIDRVGFDVPLEPGPFYEP
jgi:hypothetical protein